MWRAKTGARQLASEEAEGATDWTTARQLRRHQTLTERQKHKEVGVEKSKEDKRKKGINKKEKNKKERKHRRRGWKAWYVTGQRKGGGKGSKKKKKKKKKQCKKYSKVQNNLLEFSNITDFFENTMQFENFLECFQIHTR